MSTIQLVKLIVNAHNKGEVIELLKANRVNVDKSKYC